MAEKQKKADANEKLQTALDRGKRAKWWTRRGSKKRGFQYLTADGSKITDAAQLERITALVIPPAWKNVRICPSERGRIQVLGIDAADRIQYRYNPKFAAAQQSKKFAKVVAFGKSLSDLRRQTNRDIALDGYPKPKVLAAMIRLINDLYIRVGSEKSVELYKTYGVTTLRNKHFKIKPRGELHLEFVGKHHIKHRKLLIDKELAAMIADLQKFGGAKLFNYQDDNGGVCSLKPRDINNYIKTATAANFSAKDFRTWGATLLAAQELAEIGTADTKTETNKNIVRVVKTVAERLGNTPAVCRSSYIHPQILQSYENGVTISEFRPRTKRQIAKIQPELLPEEVALMKLLEQQS